MEATITGFKHDAGQVREWLNADYGVETVSTKGETIIISGVELTKQRELSIVNLLKGKVEEPVVDAKHRMIDELKDAIAPALEEDATIADIQAALTAVLKHIGLGD